MCGSSPREQVSGFWGCTFCDCHTLMGDSAGSGHTSGRWAESREYRVLQWLFSPLSPGVFTDCQSKTLTGNGKTHAYCC